MKKCICKCDTSFFFFLTLSAAQQQQDSEQHELHGVRWYEEKQLAATLLYWHTARNQCKMNPELPHVQHSSESAFTSFTAPETTIAAREVI